MELVQYLGPVPLLDRVHIFPVDQCVQEDGVAEQHFAAEHHGQGGDEIGAKVDQLDRRHLCKKKRKKVQSVFLLISVKCAHSVL